MISKDELILNHSMEFSLEEFDQPPEIEFQLQQNFLTPIATNESIIHLKLEGKSFEKSTAKRLVLNHEFLWGTSLEDILCYIETNPNLEEIEFSENLILDKLSKETRNRLFASIGKSKIYSCCIKMKPTAVSLGFDIIEAITALVTKGNITHLNLSECSLGYFSVRFTHLKNLCSAIANTSLKELNLRGLSLDLVTDSPFKVDAGMAGPFNEVGSGLNPLLNELARSSLETLDLAYNICCRLEKGCPSGYFNLIKNSRIKIFKTSFIESFHAPFNEFFEALATPTCQIHTLVIYGMNFPGYSTGLQYRFYATQDCEDYFKAFSKYLKTGKLLHLSLQDWNLFDFTPEGGGRVVRYHKGHVLDLFKGIEASELQSLDLCDTQLGKIKASILKAMGESIANSKITSLSLESNDFTYHPTSPNEGFCTGIQVLTEFISTLKRSQLAVLTLPYCQIDFQTAVVFNARVFSDTQQAFIQCLKELPVSSLKLLESSPDPKNGSDEIWAKRVKENQILQKFLQRLIFSPIMEISLERYCHGKSGLPFKEPEKTSVILKLINNQHKVRTEVNALEKFGVPLACSQIILTYYHPCFNKNARIRPTDLEVDVNDPEIIKEILESDELALRPKKKQKIEH